MEWDGCKKYGQNSQIVIKNKFVAKKKEKYAIRIELCDENILKKKYFNICRYVIEYCIQIDQLIVYSNLTHLRTKTNKWNMEFFF